MRWITGKPPVPMLNPNDGLPKLYLCKVLQMSKELKFSYTYRIGFVTADSQWNIDKAAPNMKVTAYMEIIANETQAALYRDVKLYEQQFIDAMMKDLKP